MIKFFDVAPAGWSQDRMTAFHDLCGACLAFMIYDNAITRLNIQDATLLQRRTELGQLITQNLGPLFRNT